MTSRKLRVLAVDDDAFSLDILQTDLEEGGFEVVRAESGVVALARLNDTPGIDAVVLDHVMPGMDGMELLKKLKASTDYGGIPVIMHTSDYKRQNKREGMEAGAFDYLITPYDERHLIHTIKTAIKGEILQQEG